eukprot:366116_1
MSNNNGINMECCESIIEDLLNIANDNTAVELIWKTPVSLYDIQTLFVTTSLKYNCLTLQTYVSHQRNSITFVPVIDDNTVFEFKPITASNNREISLIKQYHSQCEILIAGFMCIHMHEIEQNLIQVIREFFDGVLLLYSQIYPDIHAETLYELLEQCRGYNPNIVSNVPQININVFADWMLYKDAAQWQGQVQRSFNDQCFSLLHTITLSGLEPAQLEMQQQNYERWRKRMTTYWRFFHYFLEYLNKKSLKPLDCINDYMVRYPPKNKNSISYGGFGLDLVKQVCKECNQQTGQYTKTKKHINAWAQQFHEQTKIFLKTPNAKTIVFDTNMNATVQSLKNQIQEEEKIPYSNQILVFDGIVLQNKEILKHYNIQNENVLSLQIKTQILVKTLDGTIITLDVKMLYTAIHQIKKKLQHITNIPSYKQRLFCSNTELWNEKILSDYYIRYLKDTLSYIALISIDTTILWIRTLSDQRILFPIKSPNETIQSIKQKIENDEGIPVQQQRLIFHGIELENDKTLYYYNFVTESVLYLLPIDGDHSTKLNIVITNDRNYIQTMNSRRLVLYMLPNDKILCLKKQIEVLHQISRWRQILQFRDQILYNDTTLQDYDIKHESTIIAKIFIQIIVETSHESLRYDVYLNDRIQSVKNLIQKYYGIPSGNLRLMFEDKVLKDECTLSTYNIYLNSTIQLKIMMQLFIHKLNGEIILLDIESNEKVTVQMLKERIEKEQGIPSNEQRLIVGDTELQDDAPLSAYNIHHENGIQYYLALLSADSDPPFIWIQMVNQLFVNGRKILLHIEGLNVTVLSIKSKIEKIEETPLSNQALFFSSELLNNEKTLSYYNIKLRSVLYLSTCNSVDKLKA